VKDEHFFKDSGMTVVGRADPLSVKCLLFAALFLFQEIVIAPGLVIAVETIYVSPSGSDTNSGRLISSPVRSLIAARDLARAFRKTEPRAVIVIELAGGIYHINETIVFDLSDSATEPGRTEIVARVGEKPILSGTRIIRAPWMQLNGTQTTNLPIVAKENVWAVSLPKNTSKFYTLYEDHIRLLRASTMGTRQLLDPGVEQGKPTLEENQLIVPEKFLKRLQSLSDAELKIIPTHPWSTNILPIVNVDRGLNIVSTQFAATYRMSPVPSEVCNLRDGSMWIENVPEGMLKPGTWFLDYSNRVLYVWPKSGKAPNSNIGVPAVTELIKVEGKIDYDGAVDLPVTGLTFRGLTFTGADRFAWEEDKAGRGLQHDWEMFDRPTALVRFRGAEDCKLLDCRFTHSGGTGVRFDLHCQKNEVSGCEFSYLGGAGVVLAGYGLGTKDVNRGNVIRDCHVHHIGEILWHSPGIWAWQSGHNRIEHNHVHHTPYSAIVVSGRSLLDISGNKECSRTVRYNELDIAVTAAQLQTMKPPTWENRERFMHSRENLVAFNDIEHCMEKLGDGNGVYVSGAGANNRVDNNFIHDIPSQNINASIRCDDDQKETIIENNVIARVCGEGFILKGKNQVTNNVFFDIRDKTPAGLDCVRSRGYIVFSGDSVAGSVIERNIFVSRTKSQSILFEYTSTTDRNGNAREPSVLRSCAADRNLYFNMVEPGWGKKHIEAQQKFGIEQLSVEANPRFLNPAKNEFGFKEDSQAKSLGIQPIDISTVGPR
jgi:hypothetical protein